MTHSQTGKQGNVYSGWSSNVEVMLSIESNILLNHTVLPVEELQNGA